MAYYKKIICVLPIVLLLLYGCPPIYSQNFEGEYRSDKTSFKDEINPINNFIEVTRFNIRIVPIKGKEEGVIIIQDPRIPEKRLIYSIMDFVGELDEGHIKSYIFQGRPEHTSEQESILTLYINVKGNLNLMVSNSKSSQVFFELKATSQPSN